MSEILGIIRNSVERGWAIEEVRASLLNAGYSQQEVDTEIKAYSLPQQIQSQSVVKPMPVKPVQVAKSQVKQVIPQNIQPAVQKIVQTQTAQPQISAQQPVPKYNPQSLKNYQTPEVEKQASKVMVILIILLLILCVAGGVALFFFS